MIVYKLDTCLDYPGIRWVIFEDWYTYRDLFAEKKRIIRKWVPMKCRHYTMEDFHDSTCRTKRQSQTLFDRGHADYIVGVPSFSKLAKKALGPVLKDYGEFLPLEVEGNTKDFFYFHCTCLLDVIDEQKSLPSIVEGRVIGLRQLVFVEQSMKDAFFFRLAIMPFETKTYCTREFVAIVQSLGLTGFEFKEVWRSSDEPPLPKTAKKKRKWSDRS